jgi:hypothetical protein
VAKKKIGHSVPWTNVDVGELKAHSQTRTPVAVIAKKMKRTEGRFGERRVFSASLWDTAAVAAPTEAMRLALSSSSPRPVEFGVKSGADRLASERHEVVVPAGLPDRLKLAERCAIGDD